jgi:hypothetical protein
MDRACDSTDSLSFATVKDSNAANPFISEFTRAL